MSQMEKLNKMVFLLKGSPMTSQQKAYLTRLQRKVALKKLTVEDAKKLWNGRYHVWKTVVDERMPEK